MPNSEKTLKPVRFADYTFDPAGLTLSKGSNRVHLRPLAARLLALLLEQPGALVTHDRLRAGLWSGRVVEWETGVHRLVQELRRALDEDGRHPRHIETVTRRGYRFRLTDEAPSHAGASSTHGTFLRVRWFVAGSLALPAAVLAVCVYLGLTSP